MSTRGGAVRRSLPDVVFLLVVSLAFAVPIGQHLTSGTTGASGGSTGSSDSSGTSSGDGSGDGSSNGSGDGSSNGSSDAGGDPAPTGEPSPPSTPAPSPTSAPTSTTNPNGTGDGGDGGDTGDTSDGTSGSSSSRDDGAPPSVPPDQPQTVGSDFVTTILSLPIWLPLYCLAGILDDDAAESLPDGVPSDVARDCSNIQVADFPDGSSATSGGPTALSDDTPIKVEVLAPKPGQKKPQVRVTPMPDGSAGSDAAPDDNSLLGTLLVIALLVILVLAVALVLVLRRRKQL